MVRFRVWWKAEGFTELTLMNNEHNAAAEAERFVKKLFYSECEEFLDGCTHYDFEIERVKCVGKEEPHPETW